MNKDNLLRLLLIFILFNPAKLFSQDLKDMPQSGNYYTPLNSYTYHLIDRIDIKYNNTYQYLHTGVKPFLRKNIAELVVNYSKSDSLSRQDKFNINYLCADNQEFCSWNKNEYFDKPLFNFLYENPATFYQFFTIFINPVIHDELGFSNDTSELKFINTRGLELRGSIDNKVGFYLYAADNQAKFPEYINERIDEAPQVTPGEGFSKIFKETGVDYSSTHGYIGFNATKHIQLQFGQDKIFIGDGIRSLIWSDNSKDFLFLKINTNIWRINYQNIFAELANYDGSNIYNSLVKKKYIAMHHLSVNVTKSLTIGAFESVVFDRTDPYGLDKGFELYYLNPVIFYRAVEAGLGSSDNVLLGLNWKWNLFHTASFYGQFVLDEFVFDEILAGNGWWGNKNALQLGIKYIDAFTIPNFDIQVERNTVRPYTYSYSEDNGSSYTNYAQALAHPLGANFNENIISLWYQPFPKIVLSNNLFFAQYGSDTLNSNWGGNIFLDYDTHEQEYGNFTGQGVSNNLFLNDLVISWQFWHNIFIDGKFIYRTVNSESNEYDTNEMYFAIGIRINDALRRFDF